jgi:integrase
MTVYAERRRGRQTGKWIVEWGGIRRRATSREHGFMIEDELRLGGPQTRREATVYTLDDLARDSRSRYDGKRSQALGEQRWHQCITILGRDTPVKDIRTKQLDRLVGVLQARKVRNGKTMSGSTINRYLAEVSGALKWAWKRDLIVGKPHIPWQDESPPRKDIVTPADEQRIITALLKAGQDVAALCVEVLVSTGLRANELLKLRPEDLRLSGNVGWITVRAEIAKNGRERTVPLPMPLPDRLAPVLARGGLPDYMQLYRAYKAACAACDLPATIGLHTLRHTCGTRLSTQGVNALTIQDYLGHRDIRTTRGYVHTESEALLNAATALQAARRSHPDRVSHPSAG